MTSRFVNSSVALLVTALLFAGCAESNLGMRPAEFPPPRADLATAAPHAAGHCDSDGHCQLALEENGDARALCAGNAPMLYWNKGRENYLLACECNCSSHDNTGWLIDASTGMVQSVALGKPALAPELADVEVVEDILASHRFCEAIDARALQGADFVSLIKYPTGNDDAPYCFVPRTFVTSGDEVVIEDNGKRVARGDDEVFLATSADVAGRVLTVASRLRN